MLMDEQDKEQIENRINILNVDALAQSYNSVNISFAQMLAYIDKVRAVDMTEEIRLLLQTYRDMAQKFYALYQLSLLDEIKKQDDIKEQSRLIVEKIENLTDAEKTNLESAIPILIKARDDADDEYKRLINDFPSLLQSALDKLKDEWQRLNTIATASQTLTKDEKLIRALMTVAEAAAHSVGIDAERIVIIPGNGFALYFFSYLEKFAVLTVPIYSMRAPWEWSIFWHELAGYRVRQLENSATINDLRGKLMDFHGYYRALGVEDRKALIDSITRNNQYDESNFNKQVVDEIGKRKNIFSRDYLNLLFPNKVLNLKDFGSFEYLFECMLGKLPKKNRFKEYEKIKLQGWCVGWVKELFEDAWSVLAIRENFLPFFKDMLGRHSTTDDRHPPLTVRLNVASELLKLMNFGSEAVNDSESEAADNPENEAAGDLGIMEKIAAEQIFKFISLLLVASYKFEKTIDQKFNLSNILQYSLSDAVGNEIGKSIEKWSTEILKADSRVRNARENAEDFINAFSDQELAGFISNLANSSEEVTDQIKPSFENLLKDKDYKKLLELSFYDVDLGTAEVRDVFYKGVQKFTTARLQGIPEDVVSGLVKYTFSSTGIIHQTSIDEWNTKAAPGSLIEP
jgi:hypothetical protein